MRRSLKPPKATGKILRETPKSARDLAQAKEMKKADKDDRPHTKH